MSREPSYYEIALTQRQVVIAFVILLTCLVAAFFSGVWVGSGDRGPQAGALLASQEGGTGVTPDTPPPAGPTPAPPTARPAGEPSAGGEPEDVAGGGAAGAGDADSLRFFSEEKRAKPSPAQAAAPPAKPDTAADSATPPTTGPDGRKIYADPNDPRRRSNVATPVRPLPQPPEPVDSRDTGPPGAGGPVIQVFSSHDQAQAQAVLDRLLLADLDAYLSPADVRGVVHYRVRLGPFRDREQAEAVARQLRQDLQLETWITQ